MWNRPLRMTRHLFRHAEVQNQSRIAGDGRDEFLVNRNRLLKPPFRHQLLRLLRLLRQIFPLRARRSGKQQKGGSA